MARNYLGYAAALVLFGLVLYIFLTFTQPGQGALLWIQANYQNGLALLAVAVILYYVLSAQAKPMRTNAGITLKMSCANYTGGLGRHGVKYFVIAPLVRSTWSPKYSAWLYVGPMGSFGDGIGWETSPRETAVLIRGMPGLAGEKVGELEYEFEGGLISRSEIEKLLKTEVSTADALKVLNDERKKANEAVEKFLDGGESA